MYTYIQIYIYPVQKSFLRVAFFVSSDPTNPPRVSAPALQAATSPGSWLFEVDPRELRPEESEAYQRMHVFLASKKLKNKKQLIHIQMI